MTGDAEAPTPASAAARGGSLARLVTPAIALIALVQLGTALWMVVAPHDFFEQAGPFGVYNGHYLRDAAAFQGGLGVALVAALVWPALRAGALAAMLATTTFHALNHWIDVDEAHAGSNAGLSDAILLTVLALILVVLLRVVLRERTA
jgi:predicted anti-sigma-YlaC factor YlaD